MWSGGARARANRLTTGYLQVALATRAARIYGSGEVGQCTMRSVAQPATVGAHALSLALS